jgi:hypothetical protein
MISFSQLLRQTKETVYLPVNIGIVHWSEFGKSTAVENGRQK